MPRVQSISSRDKVSNDELVKSIHEEKGCGKASRKGHLRKKGQLIRLKMILE